MSTSTMLGIVLVVVGAAALALGGWSAATLRRPGWLSAKRIPEGSVRMWGAGTALAGLGLAVYGLDQLVLFNTVVGLAGFVLIVCGAGLVAVAAPRTRRSR